MTDKLEDLGDGVLVHRCAGMPELPSVFIVYMPDKGWAPHDGEYTYADFTHCPYCGTELAKIDLSKAVRDA